jgi:hypothetical protein
MIDVVHRRPEDLSQMAFEEEKDVVQALPTDTPQPALADRIGNRTRGQ